MVKSCIFQMESLSMVAGPVVLIIQLNKVCTLSQSKSLPNDFDFDFVIYIRIIRNFWLDCFFVYVYFIYIQLAKSQLYFHLWPFAPYFVFCFYLCTSSRAFHILLLGQLKKLYPTLHVCHAKTNRSFRFTPHRYLDLHVWKNVTRKISKCDGATVV